MKKLIVKMFIAVLVLGGIPNLAVASTLGQDLLLENNTAGFGRFRVDARSTNSHTVTLAPGYASIAISGDGDTDLDIYVFDSNGLVAFSESDSDDEVTNITIYRGGIFRVDVVNRGRVYNDYILAVR